MAMTAKACPFCGDVRFPSIEEIVMTMDPPNLFSANCQCCGAEGPLAVNRGSALVLWDERCQPGETEGFTKLADRLAGANE